MESSNPEVVEIHNPGTILLLTIFVAAAFQGVIYYWQKNHNRSFLMVSLAGLWLIPMIIAVSFRNIVFLSFWSAYLIINTFLFKKALQKPVHVSTPRLVYRFFHIMFQGTFCLGIIGYVSFLANTFLIMSTGLFEISVLMIFYAVYFGVVSRDMIDLASDMLTSNLGYYNRSGFPEKHLKPFVCAICGGNADRPISENDLSSSLLNTSESCITLNCQHTFHEFCLRGWCLIGKKDHCPYCKEKVELSLIRANPWKNPEFLYGRFLDFMRYLIVWQPVLLILFNVVFYITGN